jgi:hypothetical protein
MIKLAFYKGWRGDWIDKLISIWTMGPYSHVELIFSDGMSFSSSIRDDGTRFKNIIYDDKWDIIELNFPFDEIKMREFCESQNDKPYDLLGVFFSAGLKLNLQDKNKWFCTEIIGYSLYLGGLNDILKHFKFFSRVTPNNLYKYFIGFNEV